MDRATGIQPVSSGWKPEVQAIYHARTNLVRLGGIGPPLPVCRTGACATLPEAYGSGSGIGPEFLPYRGSVLPLHQPTIGCGTENRTLLPILMRDGCSPELPAP
jgi:hypothetical protein